MKQTQTIPRFPESPNRRIAESPSRRVAEWAEAGGAMPVDEAVAALAAVIDHLDEADRVALLSVGAAIWGLSGGPDGGHDSRRS